MKRFQRKKEDFVCEHCGEKVQGIGYTDHCPKCLWSKHVDVNPGDREADCRGMMEPMRVVVVREGYVIHYKCDKCGYLHKVKAAENDNFEEIVGLNGN